jgi:ABC-2 type transport system ATP-binding protein
MIEGLQQPDSGKIMLFGKSWHSNEDYLHHQIGISLQETHFIDKLTVSETLLLFAGFYGLSKYSSDEVIQLVGLEEKRNTYTVNLSGGQKQRLALGIAFINKPSLLLLDEPTTGLDPSSRRELWNILLKLKKDYGTTMVLTTHYMEEASFLCDDIVIMDHGHILASGTLEQLLCKLDIGEIIEFSLQERPETIQLNLPGEIRELKWDNNTRKGWILVDGIIPNLNGFMKHIADNDFHLTSFECRKMTLEDLFISLTGRTLNDET